MASEAQAEAQAEELTLLVSANKTGFFGVYLSNYPGNPKPHQARVWRGGKDVSLGSFVTAEEAALRVARSPEGRAAAAARAAAPALSSATPQEVALLPPRPPPPAPPATARYIARPPRRW